MRILQLPIHTSGVAYYRHYLPTLHLRKAGHTVTAVKDGNINWHLPMEIEGIDPLSWVEYSMKAGIDLIHAGWSSSLEHVELLVSLREKYKVPILIDYDDDVMNVDRYNLSYKVYHEGAINRRIARMGMRVADAVSVSTDPLNSSIGRECRHTYTLPNYTNPKDWLAYPTDPCRKDDNSVRIAFAGGPSHLGDVHLVREAVEWAIDYYNGQDGKPHVKVIFFTCMPDWAEKYISNKSDPTKNRVFFVQGAETTEVWHKVIKWVSPDILIAPLQHNKFNESKSLIKCYDAAMVEGCAFACEDWPAYQEVPAKACFKVDSTVEGDWKDALQGLIENPGIRHNMSKLLKEWVLDCRTISSNINKWEAAYEAVLSRPIVKDLSDIVRPRIYGPDGNIAND